VKKSHPEQGPAANLQGEQVRYQFADGGEVPDKGDPRREGDEQPDAVLAQLADELAAAHGSLVQLHALVAITLGDLSAHMKTQVNTLCGQV